jgi:hypothetical protein
LLEPGLGHLQRIMQTFGGVFSLLVMAASVAAQNLTINIPANELNSIKLSPAGGWSAVSANGAFNAEGQFLLGDTSQGKIVFTFPGMFRRGHHVYSAY